MEGNNTENLYLVCSNWMTNWIDYLTRDGTSPGPISNDFVNHKVEEEYDIHLGKDLFMLSEKFWQFLFD